MEHLLASLANLIVTIISQSGYVGVLVLMTFESTGIPIPSEVIMPFAGYLVFTGRFSLVLAVLVGTLGNVLGSLIAYEIARRGGRPLVHRFGRAVLLSEQDLARSEHWFQRYGHITVLLSRLLPVIRTYISFPAGLAEMPLLEFLGYTTIGSLAWSWLLCWLGLKAGSQWEYLRQQFHGADLIIAGLIVLTIIWWVWRHLQHRRTS